jgi:hypothetical protein
VVPYQSRGALAAAWLMLQQKKPRLMPRLFEILKEMII